MCLRGDWCMLKSKYFHYEKAHVWVWRSQKYVFTWKFRDILIDCNMLTVYCRSSMKTLCLQNNIFFILHSSGVVLMNSKIGESSKGYKGDWESAERAHEWKNKPVLNNPQRSFHTSFLTTAIVLYTVMQTFKFSLWTSPIKLAHCD